MDVSNLDRLAAEEERPEVAEWLRDLANRVRTALRAVPTP